MFRCWSWLVQICKTCSTLVEYCPSSRLVHGSPRWLQVSRWKVLVVNCCAQVLMHLAANRYIGLAFCHSQYVVHRDLKPTQLLMRNGCLLISDFDCAEYLLEGRANRRRRVRLLYDWIGTRPYMAPEVKKHPKLSLACRLS